MGGATFEGKDGVKVKHAITTHRLAVMQMKIMAGMRNSYGLLV
jgi:hypothetical protein